jgi:hypothetical protein
VTTTRICDGILQWLPTPVQQFSLFTTTPVQRLSLHPYNDSPSSQWLPTPVRRFTLFTMAPYTCATILPLHDGSLLNLSCLRRHIYYGSLHLFTMAPYTCTTILLQPIHEWLHGILPDDTYSWLMVLPLSTSASTYGTRTASTYMSICKSRASGSIPG